MRRIKSDPCPALLALALTVFWPLAALGAHQAQQQYRFQRVRTEDGLSNPVVRCVLQDRSGLMWFGTEDGLNRFDGYDVVVFRPEEPVAEGFPVWSMHEDAKGALWLASATRGLYRFDPNSRQFTRIRIDVATSRSSSDPVFFIEVTGDESGTIWLGTHYSGLIRYDPVSKQAAHDPLIPGESVQLRSILPSRTRPGQLWLGTRTHGLLLFDPERETWERFSENPRLAGNQGAQHPAVTKVIETDSGQVWVGAAPGGVKRLEEAQRVLRKYVGGGVRTLVEDGSNQIWAGMAVGEGGLRRLNRNGTGEWSAIHHDRGDPHSLIDDDIYCLFKDRAGLLWVGTSRGVSWFDPQPSWISMFQALPVDSIDLAGNSVFAVYELNDGTLCIGHDQAFQRYDSTGKRLLSIRNNARTGMGHSPVRTICSDPDSSGLWLGSKLGLRHWDPETRKVTRIEIANEERERPSSISHVNAVCHDSRGDLWLGCLEGGGLFRRPQGTDTFRRFPAPTPDGEKNRLRDVRAVLEDHSRALWVAADNGVFRFNDSRTQFKHWQHEPANPASLTHGRVAALYENGRGQLWVGTVGGLNRFDHDSDRFERVFETTGLDNRGVKTLVEDEDGVLWAGTPTGIIRVTHTDTDQPRAVHMAFPNGFANPDLLPGRAIRRQNGELCFPSVSGLVVITPSAFRESAAPTVVLTDFKLLGESRPLIAGNANRPSGKPRPLTDAVTLTHDQKRVITFAFSAADFTRVRENRYSWMLEGFDRSWSPPSKRRQAVYTALPAGDYTFRVKAANSQGIWNERGTSVALKILPPWWATWWFRVGVGTALLALTVGAFRLRTQSTRERNQLLAASEERYLNLLANTSELLWCVEFDEPISLELPEMEQVERIFRGRVVEANDTFAHAYDSSLEKVIGQWRVEDFIPRSFPTSVPFLLAAVRSGYRMEDVETTEQASDGATKIFVNNFIGTIQRGMVLRVWGMCRDITKQKEDEEANRQQRDALAHVSRAATLVEIGAALAHELNQPLAAILRYAQAAHRFLDRDTPDIDKVRQILASIVKDDRRAGAVIARIRQQLRREESERDYVDINQVVQDSLALLHSELIIKNVLVLSDLAPDLPPILADSVQLQQVIINLVLNAVGAMKDVDAERSKIVIATSATGDDAIRVSISDSGTGIDEDQLEQIFQPFQTSKEGGMGVGLAINRTIVDAHGGKIWAENLSGGGARLAFTIPTIPLGDSDGRAES